MKINSEIIKANKEQLTKLNNQQKHHIANREAEIELINKMSQKKISDTKLEGETEFHQQVDKNQQQLVENTEIHQKKLENLKTNLQDTAQRLRLEESKLKINNLDKISNINQNFDDKIKETYSIGDQRNRDVNFNINETIKDVEANTERTISEIQYATKLKLDESQNLHNLKLLDAEDGQDNELKNKIQNNAFHVSKTELEHMRTIEGLKNKNKTQKLEQEKLFQAESNIQQEHYSELLKGEKKSFEDKYKAITAQHNSTLSGLQERLNVVVKGMKEQQSESLTFRENRENDNFYSIKKLEPRIKDLSKSVIIEIEVPEHERNGISISANKRSIRLTHSRRFQDRLDLDDGTTYKGGRNEVSTKEFSVPSILDATKVTEKYENGILSIKIEKA